jgi:hypothetical protein
MAAASETSTKSFNIFLTIGPGHGGRYDFIARTAYHIGVTGGNLERDKSLTSNLIIDKFVFQSP